MGAGQNDFKHSIQTSELFFIAVPSDTVELEYVTRSIQVGGEGAITVIREDGTSVVLPPFPVGTIIPISIRQVMNTGTAAIFDTAATGILCLI